MKKTWTMPAVESLGLQETNTFGWGQPADECEDNVLYTYKWDSRKCKWVRTRTNKFCGICS